MVLAQYDPNFEISLELPHVDSLGVALGQNSAADLCSRQPWGVFLADRARSTKTREASYRISSPRLQRAKGISDGHREAGGFK